MRGDQPDRRLGVAREVEIAEPGGAQKLHDQTARRIVILDDEDRNRGRIEFALQALKRIRQHAHRMRKTDNPAWARLGRSVQTTAEALNAPLIKALIS